MCLLRAWSLWAAAILLTSILAWSPAHAQNALCPPFIPSQAGNQPQLNIVFQGSPEFRREVQPLASLKGLDIPSRRAVFIP